MSDLRREFKGAAGLRDFAEALRSFQQAAGGVLAAWENLSVLDGNVVREPDEVTDIVERHYPRPFPPFEEVPLLLAAWLESVENGIEDRGR